MGNQGMMFDLVSLIHVLTAVRCVVLTGRIDAGVVGSRFPRKYKIHKARALGIKVCYWESRVERFRSCYCFTNLGGWVGGFNFDWLEYDRLADAPNYFPE